MRQLQGHRRPIVMAHEVHRAGNGIEQGLDPRRLGIQGQWLVRARRAARGISVEIGRQHAVADAQALGERLPLVRRAGSDVQADRPWDVRPPPGPVVVTKVCSWSISRFQVSGSSRPRRAI
jgi:hypothetical protein